jgi:hypothetical protein
MDPAAEITVEFACPGLRPGLGRGCSTPPGLLRGELRDQARRLMAEVAVLARDLPLVGSGTSWPCRPGAAASTWGRSGERLPDHDWPNAPWARRPVAQSRPLSRYEPDAPVEPTSFAENHGRGAGWPNAGRRPLRPALRRPRIKSRPVASRLATPSYDRARTRARTLVALRPAASGPVGAVPLAVAPLASAAFPPRRRFARPRRGGAAHLERPAVTPPATQPQAAAPLA